MQINVQATVGICAEFMSTPDAEKAEVSVVIAPLKVVSESESKLNIANGCNMFKSCHNTACWYSIAAREQKKARPGK